MMVFRAKRYIETCLLAAVVFVGFAVNAHAEIYYVDRQSGDDGRDGGSVTTAWLTLDKANSEVQPGDIVYIRAGTYSETIRPANSGTAGNYITYSRYSDEKVVITGVSDAVDLRNRHYITIDGLTITNVTSGWVNMRGETGADSSTHNVIQNCYMEEADGWAGIWMKYGANYNRILNNVFVGYTGPDSLIYMQNGASYNIIEGNTLRYGPHYGIGMVYDNYRNVIRNNVVSNRWHTSISAYANSDQTLIEGNTVLDSGENHDTVPPPAGEEDLYPNDYRSAIRLKDRRYHNGIQIGSSRCIVRNNVLINNGHMSVETYGDTKKSLNNRVYHNTFHDNYDGIYSDTADPVYGNMYLNNIFYDNKLYELCIYATDSQSLNYYTCNNIYGAALRFYPDGNTALAELENKYPVYWWDNVRENPMFVDVANRDMRLQSSSPMIGGAIFLTQAISGGSGTTISLADTSYFYDGWGIPGEQGDLIQLQGQTQTARIVSIDYDNNTITVDKALTWSAGQGVSLPYQGSAPDIGAFEYASTGGSTYTLSTSATNGTITKTPDQSAYDAGASVTVEAVAANGYEFTGWSGSLSGTTNPTTITMTSDKSITATFALVPTTPSYTLTTSATNGTIMKGPDQTTYEAGTSVTVTAVAADGYEFTGWSGSLSGTTNPTTITMTSDKSITASFALVPTIPSYTLTTSATNGTITKDPDQTTYEAGTSVTVTAAAASGFEFTGWSGSLSGTTNPTMITMDSNKSITATFVEQAAEDETPPRAVASSPETDAVQVPINSLVVVHVLDDGDGVDAATVRIGMDGTVVYAGDVASYESDLGVCRRRGTPADYTYTFNASAKFDRDETINVSVNAADLKGNVMDEYLYAFATEMWIFGANRSISSNSVALGGLIAVGQDADMGHPATARDGNGSIWVVWHGGTTGQRDIYFSVLRFGSSGFTSPVRLTTDTADQSNPAISTGPDDRLYVVWQDDRQGNWDIYFSTSPDGVNWSTSARLTDSDYNQTTPAIAVDNESRCYVAYEDDQAGNQDIYVVSSTNRFTSQTTSRITSVISDQTDSAIAVDASGNVYCLWTDERNGTQDIYGAGSSDSWSNTPVATGAGNQYAPALATEATGTMLHLVWADDAVGHDDVYYAYSDGMPASALAGTNIVDDTGQTNQSAPAIAVTGSTGNGLKVYVCWQDWRNATADGDDTDLYFVQVKDGDETNVLVGDGGIGSNQGQPAIGADIYGYPYIVWGDDRDADVAVYYAGATYWSPDVVDEQEVTASEGGTVGTSPVAEVGDVSVVIPAGALATDVTVSIAKVENPQATPSSRTVSYEFGPSGLEFTEPVTITIPYAVEDFGGDGLVPYWYNSRTDSLSQSGISDIEDIAISATVRAVRFKTSHFTSFYLVSSSAASPSSSGGGCSLSPTGEGSAVQFFLPYAALAVVMWGLRRRDQRADRIAHGGTGDR